MFSNNSIRRHNLTLKLVITAFIFGLIIVVTTISFGQSFIDDIDTFKWQHRIILAQPEPDCVSTEKALMHKKTAVTERHILWFVICDNKVISNFEGVLSDQFIDKIKTKYFNQDHANVILIGKDGGIKRRSKTLDLISLFDLIDSMPMRQLEMQES